MPSILAQRRGPGTRGRPCPPDSHSCRRVLLRAPPRPHSPARVRAGALGQRWVRVAGRRVRPPCRVGAGRGQLPRGGPSVARMSSDDGLVRELAELMHRAENEQVPAAGDPAEDDGRELVRVDLDTFEAAHEASRWTDDEPPQARRRRTG